MLKQIKICQSGDAFRRRDPIVHASFHRFGEYPHTSPHLPGGKAKAFNRSADGQTKGLEQSLSTPAPCSHLIHAIRKGRCQAPTLNWPDLIKDLTDKPGRSKSPTCLSWQPGFVMKTKVMWQCHYKNWYDASAISIFSLSILHRTKKNNIAIYQNKDLRGKNSWEDEYIQIPTTPEESVLHLEFFSMSNPLGTICLYHTISSIMKSRL